METVEERTGEPGRLGRLRSAFGELLDQEFALSTGHLAALLNGCAFAPSLLPFWVVNGALDFTTAVAIGAAGGPGGLAVRVLAYVLLLPAFLLARTSYYLLHPGHRATVLSGSCPTARLLSLDWLGVGVLATGLPLALQDAGPWLAANAVFLVGVFLLPRPLPERAGPGVRLGAIAGGSLLFLYAKFGAALTVLPSPAATLGPVATLRLSEGTTAALLAATNSLLVGPVVVALFALVLDRLLTRPELTSVPVLARTLPGREPARVVLASAAFGTLFYLSLVALATGRLVVLP